MQFYLEQPLFKIWKSARECLKQWAHEVHDVRVVIGKTLFVQLPAVETEDE